MLKKIFKYEFKSYFPYLPLLWCAVLLLGLLSGLSTNLVESTEEAFIE